MGEAGHNLGDDNFGDSDRGYAVGFNRELHPAMKPETPDTLAVGGIDGSHGDQARCDEQAVGHPLHQADVALHADPERQVDGQGIGYHRHQFGQDVAAQDDHVTPPDGK